MIEKLAESGIDPNWADNDGRSSLHYCAKVGDLDLAMLLINLGANIFQPDSAGSSASTIAETNHHYSLAGRLRALEKTA